jgi:type III pantothenate kinase
MRKRQNRHILIAIDIGNTHIYAGIFTGSRLTKRIRIATDAGRETIYRGFKRLLKAYIGYAMEAVISSVVPHAAVNVKGILRDRFGITSITAGRGLKVPVRNLYKRPVQVGQDRLVNAYACKEIYGKPAVVIDFGTATTFDYVNKRGEYEGGIITPGVMITIDSLHEKTALLPKVRLKKPKRLVGRDTIDSIRSGVIHGIASMCDGLIEKIRIEKKTSPIVIATGGLADIFRTYSVFIDKIDSDLTLKGLYLIFLKKGLTSYKNLLK